jgi:endonuclease YncB( thermonuclease family)
MALSLASKKDLDELNWFHPVNNFSTKIPVKVLSVYDGDTCTIAFNLYGDIRFPIVKYRARLIGIDTPEMKGKGVSQELKDLAKKARDFLREKVVDKTVDCIFDKECDKYGRVLITIYDSNGVNINDELVTKGYAKKYDGGTKEKWDA